MNFDKNKLEEPLLKDNDSRLDYHEEVDTKKLAELPKHMQRVTGHRINLWKNYENAIEIFLYGQIGRLDGIYNILNNFDR